MDGIAHLTISTNVTVRCY